ncbi:MAG: hypothetical protein IJJ96_02870 [Bacteroidales bacterium]|nr:hypothetical protein [Bacteroidales bacterium]
MKKKTNNEPLEESNESVIMYMRWVICLWEFGLENFGKAMYALFNYACYNKAISSFKLPRIIEATLNTFTPIIDANRRKRENAKKGAPYGKLGGRPKNPSGVSLETPNVNETDTKNENETVLVNESVAEMENHLETGHTTNKAHTDSLFFLFVFFFRNLLSPKKQAEKFVTHYTATGWRLGGGDYVATDEQRIALAMKWEVKDDKIGRFKEEDLAMWHSLYDIAPPGVKIKMLDSGTKFLKSEQGASITCHPDVTKWIEASKTATWPIIRRWMAPIAKLTYFPCSNE